MYSAPERLLKGKLIPLPENRSNYSEYFQGFSVFFMAWLMQQAVCAQF